LMISWISIPFMGWVVLIFGAAMLLNSMVMVCTKVDRISSAEKATESHH
jgi:hypothetical protein